MVIATIAVIMLLNYGEPFFVPFLVALLLSYALAPVVYALTFVVRYRALAAGLVVSSIVALIGLGVWAWSDDIEGLVQKVPAAAKTISRSLQRMAQKPGNPVAEVQKAAKEVDALTRDKSTPAAPPPAQPTLSVWQVVWKGWTGFVTAGTQTMAVLFLVFFMLASGDLFKRKLMTLAGPRLSERKDALRVIEEIDRQIRRYLGVLLISNVLVGLGTWAAYAALGVEYAGLWAWPRRSCIPRLTSDLPSSRG
jgi:predicted PurR-regulated permease PerM